MHLFSLPVLGTELEGTALTAGLGAGACRGARLPLLFCLPVADNVFAFSRAICIFSVRYYKILLI